MEYALINGKKTRAEKTLIGMCPCCNSKVIAKCGNINAWHFAHINGSDCDSFSEGETEWHIQWKNKFPESNREVVMWDKEGKLFSPSYKHRADIFYNNLVIELQNSPISTSEIYTRESFYNTVCEKGMIWLINLTYDYETYNKLGLNNFKIYQPKNGATNYLTFRWKHARRSFISYYKIAEVNKIKKPRYFVNLTDYRIFEIKKIHQSENGRVSGWGYLYSVNDFLKMVGCE